MINSAAPALRPDRPALRHHAQEFNKESARLQAIQLFLAMIALLVPSAVSGADAARTAAFTRTLSLCLAFLLIATYGLGLLFSLKTHRELFGGAEHLDAEERAWPMGVALATLAVVTVLGEIGRP